MNDYAFDLNLPCTVLNQEFDYKKILTPHSRQSIADSLSPDFVTFMDSIGLRIISVEMFRRRPDPVFNTIHIDDHNQHDRARINYVIEDVDSVMGFFKPKNDDSGFLTNGAVGGQPRRYHLHEVDLVYQHVIKKPSVIQTGIPHGVLNPHGVRYSLAIHVCNKNSNSVITFEDAQRIFQKYIVA